MLDGVDIAVTNTLLNKQITELKINSYVTYNGKQYKAIESAKNLKTVQIDAPDVSLEEGAFVNVSRKVQFKGKGIENMMLDYAKKMLQTYDISIPKYDASNIYERKCSLYTIAKFVDKKFTYSSSKYDDNIESGIHTLLYMRGNSLGFARAVRILATAAGYDKNVIRVGGDDMNFGWNFVEFERKWYILDIAHTTYNDRDLCSTN
eukprot:jgi/Orpsp1_1/1191054/evm.model.d7180000083200.1